MEATAKEEETPQGRLILERIIVLVPFSEKSVKALSSTFLL